ncbi:MAG: sensor histidine kinase [Phototrophicaceae bacterium]|jgi:two-component system phosphate regulon sensor histidine kinase PhoR
MVNHVLYITDQVNSVAQAQAWLSTEYWVLEHYAATDNLLSVLANTDYDVYLLDDPMANGEPTSPMIRLAREAGVQRAIIAFTESHGRALVALKAGATDAIARDALTPALLERLLSLAVLRVGQSQLEYQLNIAQKQEQLKTDMIRIAAHDLRGPLNTLNGYIGLLAEDLSNLALSDPLSYLNEMQRCVERMERLIEGILSLERIEQYREGYTDLVDLSVLIGQVASQYSAHNKITQTFRYLPPPSGLWVYGSEAELIEALENLVNNAIKYTPPAGEIVLYCTTDADSALIAVKDTGYGVPEKLQLNLFSPFFRANTPETRAIPGTGLGLHLVKQIVERHGGSIFFESAYGVGSTFGFLLPLTGNQV